MRVREMRDDAQDLVVRLAACKRRRQLCRDVLGLQVETAGGSPRRLLLERNALADVLARLAVGGDELVQEPAHLARVARDFAHALLVVVELLEREQRQVDVVLLEPEQARGIVQQDVGVEDEQLRSGSAAGLDRLARREEMQGGWGRAQLAFDHGPP